MATCTPYRGCTFAVIASDAVREKNVAVEERDRAELHCSELRRKLEAAEVELARSRTPKTKRRIPKSGLVALGAAGVLLAFGAFVFAPPEPTYVQGGGGGADSEVPDASTSLDVTTFLPVTEPALVDMVRCQVSGDLPPTQSRTFTFRSRTFADQPAVFPLEAH